MDPKDITQPSDVEEGDARRRRRDEDPQVEGHIRPDAGARGQAEESRRSRRDTTPDVEGHRR